MDSFSVKGDSAKEVFGINIAIRIEIEEAIK